MRQYLVAIYRPDDYDPSVETAAMSREIDALNEEMVADNVRIFVGGLSPAGSARSLRAQPKWEGARHRRAVHGTKEHIGGFWVLEAADLNEALAWGARLSSPAVRQSRCARFFDGGPDGSN